MEEGPNVTWSKEEIWNEEVDIEIKWIEFVDDTVFASEHSLSIGSRKLAELLKNFLPGQRSRISRLTVQVTGQEPPRLQRSKRTALRCRTS